ncbi:homeobox-leucine zipper protein HDG11-like [Henckelia pumila]|uniref:homeobox-leucine zipper protein HDG11-like n=1 Tax=Henckelia pumila TaxID=405737 RepID=UPI003C6DCD9F
MNLAGGGRGSGDEETFFNRKGNKQYHRHSLRQIQQLEAFFKECPHPDENQRQQLSRKLGLDLKQVKFWFQNKRTQTKALNERADNGVIRSENERIHYENLAMREALKNVICSSCNGSGLGEGEKECSLQRLRMENVLLKEKVTHGRIIAILSNNMRKSTMPLHGVDSFSNMRVNNFLDIETGVPAPFDPEQLPWNSTTPISQHRLNQIKEMDEAVIFEAAVSAMDELVDLLRMKEPVWIKSALDGRYMLHRDSYDKLFPKAVHLKTSNARTESSKDSGEVAMAALDLIEMLLDPNKREDIFPTIVTKSRSIHGIIDIGKFDGSLSLIYEKIHILSPLVAPREFFLIRYCRQLNSNTWVMVDVSYDFIKELQEVAPTRSWKLPSGCMVEDMSNGKSIITWIEHVEVDDKSSTNRLYRDLVLGCQAYGAKRWIVTLQRMCERFALSMGLTMASKHELEGVIQSTECRRNLMKLSHRMVKNFCEMLSMSEELDFPHWSAMNNSGVRISLRKSNGQGQPYGLIVCAATCLWLPLSYENLFNFFKDEKKRALWDILSNGNSVNEIAHISTGTHPGNCISIIQPSVPKENMLMLQESCVDPLGAMMIYAPIELQAINSAVIGEDTKKIPILPSGYLISTDGRSDKGIGASTSSGTCNSSGSLLTIAFQILVCCSTIPKQPSMESIATVHALLSSTIQKIRLALNCAEVD